MTVIKRTTIILLKCVLGFVAILSAGVLPWIERKAEGVTLAGWRVPEPVPLLILGLLCVAMAWLAIDCMTIIRGLRGAARRGAWWALLTAIISIAGFWYGYILPGRIVVFEYRPAIRALLFFTGAFLVSDLVSCFRVSARTVLSISRRRLFISLACSLIAVTFSSAILLFVLDGVPHISDETTFLLQGRMLWNGYLAVEPPRFPELFTRCVMFFETAGRYYSKYPVGWPLVLGAFDEAGVAWLANPFLAGTLVLLTGQYLMSKAGRLAGTLSLLLLSTSPWLWFNGATYMSHMAAGVALMAFLVPYDRMLKGSGKAAGMFAGIALGCAVLVRPPDALFFAIPCVLLSGWLVVTAPRRWIAPHVSLVLGCLPMLCIYFGINRYLTGSSGDSTYGSGILQALFHQAPKGIVEWAAWMHESWCALSYQWYLGTLPAGALIVIGLCFGRRYLRRVPLLLWCSASFFFAYGIFVFGGRSWVGPRWYVPLMPGIAFIVSAGAVKAFRRLHSEGVEGKVARRYISLLMTGVAICWAVAVPVKILELRKEPPLDVDGRVSMQAKMMNLTESVVALPFEQEGSRDGVWQFRCKRPWAGMCTMDVPFERSKVIYVRKDDSWAQKARLAWPTRKLYSISTTPGDFTFEEVPKEK